MLRFGLSGFRAIAVVVIALIMRHRADAQSEPSPLLGETVAPTKMIETATTPRECLEAITQLEHALDGAADHLGAAGSISMYVRSRMRRLIDANRSAYAAECAAKFNVENTAPSELEALTTLEVNANAVDAAYAATERRLSLASTRADTATILHKVLVHLFGVEDRENPPENFFRFERFYAQLDSLGPEFLPMQVEVHNNFARFFGAMKDHPVVYRHGIRAYELARTMTPAQRATNWPVYLMTYEVAAEMTAEHGDISRAKAMLHEAITTLPKNYQALKWGYSPQTLIRELKRYELIGQPAPVILADYLYNTSGPTKQISFLGKVTLVEFTTTWCHSCKEAYPAIKRLYRRYRPQGLQPVFVSYIEGFKRGQYRTMPLVEELNYDQKYWIQEEGITFPLAIFNTVAQEGDELYRRLPTVFDEYLAYAFPTYFLIDKRGMVRHIQIGNGTNIEEQLSVCIQSLLAE